MAHTHRHWRHRYLPAGWFHHVHNVGPTVMVNWWTKYINCAEGVRMVTTRYIESMAASNAPCAFFDENLHSRARLSVTPLLHLKRYHSCDQEGWNSPRVVTFLPFGTVNHGIITTGTGVACTTARPYKCHNTPGARLGNSALTRDHILPLLLL
jgi:hypothetical protein